MFRTIDTLDDRNVISLRGKGDRGRTSRIRWAANVAIKAQPQTKLYQEMKVYRDGSGRSRSATVRGLLFNCFCLERSSAIG